MPGRLGMRLEKGGVKLDWIHVDVVVQLSHLSLEDGLDGFGKLFETFILDYNKRKYKSS